MTVIRDYWEGVRQRLQAEVDVFSSLVAHRGEQGRENEVALQRVLESLLPKRIGVGTGLVIDRSDHYSKQADLILYDSADEPAILAQTTQLLFPIETVLAVIEVKTTFRSGDFEDCFEKRRCLNALEATPWDDGSVNEPLFVVLAYDTDQSPENLARRLAQASPDDVPDLMSVVRYGFLSGKPPLLDNTAGGPTSALVQGVSLLKDGGGWRQPSAGSNGVEEQINGHLYPIVELGGVDYVSDPAKGLLLFIEALVRGIAKLQGRRGPAFSNYLDQETRTMHFLYGEATSSG